MRREFENTAGKSSTANGKSLAAIIVMSSCTTSEFPRPASARAAILC
jgi:hypothetical protein